MPIPSTILTIHAFLLVESFASFFSPMTRPSLSSSFRVHFAIIDAINSRGFPVILKSSNLVLCRCLRRCFRIAWAIDARNSHGAGSKGCCRKVIAKFGGADTARARFQWAIFIILQGFPGFDGTVYREDKSVRIFGSSADLENNWIRYR